MNWTSEAIDALWDFSDPAASEQRFRDAVADGAGDEARTQVVRALGLQGRFEEAQLELDAIPKESALVSARASLEQGRLLRSSGRPSEARPWFERALADSEVAGADYYALDALHMIALVQPEDESIATSLSALRRAEASPDPRCVNWAGSIANNLGWTFHDAGRYDEALEQFERAVRARERQGDAGRLGIARWCVARCLRSLGRHEDALAILTELDQEDGYVHEEIGENRLALGLPSQTSFAEAWRRLQGQADEERLKRLAELGGIV